MANQPKIASTQKVTLGKDVLIQDLKGEAVLLDLKSEQYFNLDDVSTQMISVLTDSDSIEAAYETLQGQYEVEPDRLKQDLLEYIEKLQKDGLVEVIEA